MEIPKQGYIPPRSCNLTLKISQLQQFQLRNTSQEISDDIHREIFSKSYKIKPKSECIYNFPIDLELNGRSFGSKSIGA